MWSWLMEVPIVDYLNNDCGDQSLSIDIAFQYG